MDLGGWVIIVYRVLLFVSGIPGNLLVIVIYRKLKVGGSTRIYIIAMAVFDLAVCLLSPAFVYNSIIRRRYQSLAFCIVFTLSYLLLMFISMFLITMIAVDRYLKICQSQRIKTSTKRAKYSVIFCVVISVILIIPYLFELTLKRSENGDVICDRKSDSMGTAGLVMYGTYLLSFVFAFVSYGLIYKRVKRQIKKRAQQFNKSFQTTTARPTAAPAIDSSKRQTSTQTSTRRNPTRQNNVVTSTTSGSQSGNQVSITGRGNRQVSAQIPSQGDSTCHKNGPSEGPFSSATGSSASGGDPPSANTCPSGKAYRQQSYAESRKTTRRAGNHLSVVEVCGVSANTDSQRMAWVASEHNIQDSQTDRANPQQPSGPVNTQDQGTQQADRRALDKTTKMMLVITLVYFTTWIPEQIIRLTTDKLVLLHLEQTHTAAYILIEILRNSAALNYVINPIVYAINSKMFRDDALKSLKL